jgi:predicted PurR-regulated permease PerM
VNLHNDETHAQPDAQHSQAAPSAYTDTSSDRYPAAFWRGLRQIPWRAVARVVLVVLALLGIAWLFIVSWSALLPFQLGVVVAYLILPFVNRLEHFIPRWASIIVVYIGGIALSVTAIAFLIPPLVGQATQALERLPSVDEIEEQVQEIFAAVEAYRSALPAEVAEPIDEAIAQTVGSLQRNITTYTREALAFLVNSTVGLINTFNFVFGFLIVPFWIFYVLKDERQGRDTLNDLLPTSIRADFWAILTIIDRIFSGYIRGQLFLGLMVGLAAWVGLTALNLAGFEIQYVLLLAVIAGVTELIPLVGPVIGAVPAVIIALFDSPTTALAVLALYILIQQLENSLLVPRIVGESVGIHPAVLIIVLVLCTQVLGFFWIILAAPIAAVLRDVFRYMHGRLSDPPRPAGVLPDEPLPAHAGAPPPQPEAAPGASQPSAVEQQAVHNIRSDD